MTAIGIVGLGQIGGSLALRLLAQRHEVLGFDTDGATQLTAKAHGVRVMPDLSALVAQSTLVFCCVSLPANKAVVQHMLELAGAGAQGGPLITDVASQKGGTLPSIPSGTRFVAGHPMAGSHGWGFRSARAELFEDTVWNLILESAPAADALLALMNVILSTGARVHACSAQWHDQTVALTSGLPHALALVLGMLSAELPDSAQRLTLAAGSFRGASRVLLSEPDFVAGLLRYNEPELRGLLHAASAALQQIEASLSEPDTLGRLVQRARVPIQRLQAAEWQTSQRRVRLEALGDVMLALRDRSSLVDKLERHGEHVQLSLRSHGPSAEVC